MLIFDERDRDLVEVVGVDEALVVVENVEIDGW